MCEAHTRPPVSLSLSLRRTSSHIHETPTPHPHSEDILAFLSQPAPAPMQQPQVSPQMMPQMQQMHAPQLVQSMQMQQQQQQARVMPPGYMTAAHVSAPANAKARAAAPPATASVQQKTSAQVREGFCVPHPCSLGKSKASPYACTLYLRFQIFLITRPLPYRATLSTTAESSERSLDPCHLGPPRLQHVAGAVHRATTSAD